MWPLERASGYTFVGRHFTFHLVFPFSPQKWCNPVFLLIHNNQVQIWQFSWIRLHYHQRQHFYQFFPSWVDGSYNFRLYSWSLFPVLLCPLLHLGSFQIKTYLCACFSHSLVGKQHVMKYKVCLQLRNANLLHLLKIAAFTRSKWYLFFKSK